MESYIIITIVLAFFLFAIILKDYFDSKKLSKKRLNKVNKAYGKLSDKKYSPDELLLAKKLFYRYQNDNSIDDISALDLDIDSIFKKFNISLSGPGTQYLYYLLRNPEYEKENLELFEKRVSFFCKNKDKALKARAFFLGVGSLKKADFFDVLDYFDTVESKKTIKEITLLCLSLLSIVGLFFIPTPSLIVLISIFVFSIIDYYQARGMIEPYVLCFAYIINILKEAKKIKVSDFPENEDEINRLYEICNSMKSFEKASFLVTGSSRNTGAGNPFDILADYLKMLLHIDIIKFYQMLDVLKKNKDQIEEIYIIIGKLETYVTIASLREALPYYCIPQKGEGISFENLYHPLIEEPVKNSLTQKNSVLITGSNASGKSTFLKTVALNTIFSKTIHTCFADSFAVDDYHVLSSMSCKDDLNNKDSYFMVEIKALKRIFDYMKQYPDNKVMCFVDELLRGTNTVERIAACTQILKHLKDDNVLCFAATHDIELTDLLSKDFANYHFEEEVRDNDIYFNYLLRDGKATSKNAIKLLSIMGFSDDIVQKAQNQAGVFADTGVWRS